MMRMTMGYALVEGEFGDAGRGYDMLAEIRESCMKESYAMSIVALLQSYMARRLTVLGDVDAAISQARAAVDEVYSSSNILNCDVGTSDFVEALLARGKDNDLAEAEDAIDRLAATRPGSHGQCGTFTFSGYGLYSDRREGTTPHTRISGTATAPWPTSSATRAT